MAAVNLLLGTAAVESQMGHYIHQIKGPALGIYQMEPRTHLDIWNNYLSYKRGTVSKILSKLELTKRPKAERMIYDLQYATLMARFFYLRVKEQLPEEDDIGALANYWKKYYNTELGKGTPEKFVNAYYKYVLGGGK